MEQDFDDLIWDNEIDLEELLCDSTSGSVYGNEAKTQIKVAEKYGGRKKVIVGVPTRKSADYAERRVVFQVNEVICSDDFSGTKTHEVYIEAPNEVGVSAIYNAHSSYGGYVVADRRSKKVLAILGD